MNSIYVYYLVHLGYVYVVHLGWETNSKAIIICLFTKVKLSSACYHFFGSIHWFLPSLQISPCSPYIISLYLFLCMLDIVHRHAEHVEKKRRVLCGNTMSCRHCSMVDSMANPPPSPDYNPVTPQKIYLALLIFFLWEGGYFF